MLNLLRIQKQKRNRAVGKSTRRDGSEGLHLKDIEIAGVTNRNSQIVPQRIANFKAACCTKCLSSFTPELVKKAAVFHLYQIAAVREFERFDLIRTSVGPGDFLNHRLNRRRLEL